MRKWPLEEKGIEKKEKGEKDDDESEGIWISPSATAALIFCRRRPRVTDSLCFAA